MQTLPVMIQANPVSAPAANKPNDTNSSGTSFNQVLSREVADRSNKSDAPRQKETETRASSGQPAESAKPVEAKTSDDTKDDDADVSASGTDATTMQPQDMLALVASLAQLTPTDTAAKATGANGQKNTATAVDVAGDGTTTAKKRPSLQEINPLKATDTTQAAAPSETPVQQNTDANFAMQLDGAGKAKQQPELRDTKLSDAASRQTKPQELQATPLDLNAPKASSDLAARGKELLAAAADTQAKSAPLEEIKTSVATLPAAAMPMQFAAMNGVHQVNANTAEKLTPPVGTPAWGQALGQKIVWMVAGEQQSASLTLNPPDLGPLQVVLNVTNSQANATFIAAQPEVRQALEAAMPKLRDMLGEAGIQLGQTSVNSGSASQQGAPDRQPSSFQGRGAEQNDSRLDAPVRIGRIQSAVSGEGLVDTFV